MFKVILWILFKFYRSKLRDVEEGLVLIVQDKKTFEMLKEYKKINGSWFARSLPVIIYAKGGLEVLSAKQLLEFKVIKELVEKTALELAKNKKISDSILE